MRVANRQWCQMDPLSSGTVRRRKRTSIFRIHHCKSIKKKLSYSARTVRLLTRHSMRGRRKDNCGLLPFRAVLQFVWSRRHRKVLLQPLLWFQSRVSRSMGGLVDATPTAGAAAGSFRSGGISVPAG